MVKSPLRSAARSAAMLVLGKHIQWFAHEYKQAVRSSNAPNNHIRQLHTALLEGLDLGMHRDRVVEVLTNFDTPSGDSSEPNLPPLVVYYRDPKDEILFWKRHLAACRLVETYAPTVWYNLAIKAAKVIRASNRKWDTPIFIAQFAKNPPEDDLILDAVLEALDPAERLYLNSAIVETRAKNNAKKEEEKKQSRENVFNVVSEPRLARIN